MTRKACLEKNFARDEAEEFTIVTVGAAIVKCGMGSEKTPKILLLKRTSDDPCRDGIFELPGAQVYDSDRTIRNAIIRGVYEQANVRAVDITPALLSFPYTKKIQGKTLGGGELLAVQHAIDLCYLDTVYEWDFDHNRLQVIPGKHSEGTWESLDAVDTLPMNKETYMLLNGAEVAW
ncbi:Fc.00g014060.m01.CDS01 [Cosmosporella sp. VM-42]